MGKHLFQVYIKNNIATSIWISIFSVDFEKVFPNSLIVFKAFRPILYQPKNPKISTYKSTVISEIIGSFEFIKQTKDIGIQVCKFLLSYKFFVPSFLFFFPEKRESFPPSKLIKTQKLKVSFLNNFSLFLSTLNKFYLHSKDKTLHKLNMKRSRVIIPWRCSNISFS